MFKLMMSILILKRLMTSLAVKVMKSKKVSWWSRIRKQDNCGR